MIIIIIIIKCRNRSFAWYCRLYFVRSFIIFLKRFYHGSVRAVKSPGVSTAFLHIVISVLFQVSFSRLTHFRSLEHGLVFLSKKGTERKGFSGHRKTFNLKVSMDLNFFLSPVGRDFPGEWALWREEEKVGGRETRLSTGNFSISCAHRTEGY